jgi:tRNA dimethylallyltransferase
MTVSAPTRLVAVVGPTGTGKSELALNIAERIVALGGRAEIVNSDSMQLYRGMDIGTAKLTVEERRGIAHHMIDTLAITDESTAADYQRQARPIIEDLQNREITPIVVGGSMLYVAALLNTFEFPERNETLRAQLELDLLEHGAIEMHRRLAAIDASAASRITPANGRRSVRALEVVMTTGEPFAAALPDEVESWQPVLEIGLNSERAHLVERLEQRVLRMWEAGLVEETRNLEPLGIRTGKTASQAIGYSQALQQLDGTMTQDEAIASTVQLTQRYARRQMSWFKRDPRINWLDYQDPAFTEKALTLVETNIDI